MHNKLDSAIDMLKDIQVNIGDVKSSTDDTILPLLKSNNLALNRINASLDKSIKLVQDITVIK